MLSALDDEAADAAAVAIEDCATSAPLWFGPQR